jgi:hypothetical protein
VGISLGAGNCCEKASSTATDDNNLGGMRSQNKLSVSSIDFSNRGEVYGDEFK